MKLFLDGEKIKGLRSVEISADYDGVTTVRIELIATDVTAEVEPDESSC